MILLITLVCTVIAKYTCTYRRDDVVIKAPASLYIDLGFISQVESYQKIFKSCIYGFSAWRLAQKEWHGEQAGKLACCVLGHLGASMNTAAWITKLM